MASSNVQFYENQKKLQDTIINCEQQRMNLEQQLKKVFQTDQTSVKLKAARLHTYWKKICDDERKAKQRNEMILREFQRIDTHMSELNARTQRLALTKKQYEEAISRKYPQWNELLNGAPSHRQPDVQKERQQDSHKDTQQDSHKDTQQDSHKDRQQDSHKDRQQDSHKDRQQDSHKDRQPNFQKERQPDVHKERHPDSHRERQPDIQKERQPAVYNQRKFDEDNSSQPQYENIEELKERSAKVASPSNPSSLAQHAAVDRGNNFSSPKRVTQISADVLPKNSHKEEIEELIKKDFKERQDPFKFPEQEGGSEDGIEFMSGSDLPMAQSLGNTQISAHMSASADLNSSANKSVAKPELTVSGLLYLLKFIEADMVDAFSLQDYYRRSSRPDTPLKNDIIRKGNAREDLSRIDANSVSMVILEQISLIVRNLSGNCLFPISLLRGDVSGLTYQTLRQNLSIESQTIWDPLFAHFTHLVRMEAIEPNELSAIFTPCLVPDGSLQEKAHQIMCHLLEDVRVSEDKNAAPQQFNASLSPMPTLEGSNSFMEDGKVPPLKFGSLLDKPFSDDESTYINSSLPRDNIPLNETDAYKSMISTTSSLQVRRQSSTQEDTTDDDVEKQIVSAMKKPVSKPSPQPKVLENDDRSETSSQTFQTTSQLFSPRAITPRQGKPLYGSLQGRLGVKISSDLDTDTEMDAGIFGSSKKVDDDFDFYD